MLEKSDKFGLENSKIVLPSTDKQLLFLLFPNIDWSQINIVNKLPLYMRNSFAFATVLPHGISSKKLDICFKAYEAGNNSILFTLMHEAVHVQQYQYLDKKWRWGFGFFRCFMWHYLGWMISLFVKSIFIKKFNFAKASAFAYRNHPMEIEAYAYEAMFRDSYFMMGGNLEPIILVQLYPGLIRQNSSYKKSPPIWAFSLAIFFSLIITFVKPLVEITIKTYLILFRKHKN
jgi:hypothetical protein